jgi:hypothetical protein
MLTPKSGRKKMGIKLNKKLMFPWLVERAFPRVAKLMVNGGLTKERFGSS